MVSRSRLPTRSLLLIRRVVHRTTATLLIYVINIFLFQMKTASELGIIQPLKQLPIPFILRHIITTNRMVSWFLNFDIHVSHNILSAYSHLWVPPCKHLYSVSHYEKYKRFYSVPFLSFLLLKIKHLIVYTLCRQFQEKSYKTSDKIYTTSWIYIFLFRDRILVQ